MKRIRTDRVFVVAMVVAIIASVFASFWQVTNLTLDKMISEINLTGFMAVGFLGKVEVSRTYDPFVIIAGWFAILAGLVYSRWTIGGMKSERHAVSAAALFAAGILGMLVTYVNGAAGGTAVMALMFALAVVVQVVAMLIKGITNTWRRSARWLTY
jgi:hypothetical protein